MRLLISILILTAMITIAGISKTANNNESINPIIGDVSFVNKFGYKPDKYTNENLRIKTHLEYVESLLRKKDVSYLPMYLKQNRLRLLSILHDYYTAGIFPLNYDYLQCRKPCFIDRDNRICAVGYLIEKTAGRKIAEDINSKHKYDEVLAMNDNIVDSWIEGSGLTKKECAMIQPSYGPTPVSTYNHISGSYGIPSSVLGGINLSINAMNGVQMIRSTGGKIVPIAGLLTGAGQLILGATKFSKNTTTLWGNASNESQKTLSMVNIGIGTTTMILSAWNFFTKKKLQDKKTTLNLYSFPSDKKMNVGFNLTKKF